MLTWNKKGRNRTPCYWFQANTIATMSLSINEMLVKHYITLSRLSYRWKPHTSHMAYPIQLGFQDATSPIIEELLHFHNHTLIIIFLISSLVLHIISLILTTKLTHTSIIAAQEVNNLNHSTSHYFDSNCPSIFSNSVHNRRD